MPAHATDGRFFFGLDKDLEVGIDVGLIADLRQKERVDTAAGRYQVHVAANSGLGRMQIAQVVDAVDDPKIFVTYGEVENLFIRRQHNERGEANLGSNGDNVGLGVLHDAGAIGSRQRRGHKRAMRELRRKQAMSFSCSIS